jgi:phosphohistidine phosphatase
VAAAVRLKPEARRARALRALAPITTEDMTMDLILWRHAHAEDGVPDLERRLTARGRADARRVGGWLRERLPGGTARVLSSPAVRARQTADALGLRYEVVDALAPGASAAAAIAASGWEEDGSATVVVVVGHNPWIGEAVSRLVGERDEGWAIRKAGLWWLARREQDVLVRAVVSPELLR